jgi:polysaccharide export outer membrane protein
VRPDGKISLPWIRSVQAEAKTPEELEAAIVQAFKDLGGPAAQSGEARYLMSQGDELEVRFPNQPDMNQVVRVRPDGYISLSLVKAVRAEGRTVEDLEADLVKRYGVHLRTPELTVSVRNFSGNRVLAGGQIYRAGFEDVNPVVIVRAAAASVQQVFIGGEVARPGVVSYRSSLTALQLILEAGSYKPTAELGSVMIIRKSGSGQPVLIRRDLTADLKDRDGKTTNDIFLQPSDLVVVPKTGIAALAEALDQYVFQILPFVKNSTFAFVYPLHEASGSNTAIRTP